jgi:hypothetical protein
VLPQEGKQAPLKKGRRAIPRGRQATFKRRRREDRVRAAPAVSRAKAEKNTHTSIQVQRKQSGLPCAMVLTVSFGLSPVTGFLATVIPQKLASQELDASIGASGPHDFAVRNQPRSSVAAIPSIASHRTFVTIASRPSIGWDGLWKT